MTINRNNTLLLRAIRREPIPRTPIWMMRQAGRYLAEYRATRKVAGSFMQLCKTPELACEVALQPLARFKLDAAILFSDILTIPDAMGLGLYFVEGEGPCFSNPLSTTTAIEQLTFNVNELNYVMQAVQLIKANIPTDIPLIGFSGSPWTLACYMLEGKSSTQFTQIFKLMRLEPKHLQLLLDKLTEAVIQYLTQQILHGADIIMLFDTWGNLLATELYDKYSLNYLRRIINAIKQQFPQIAIILFTKDANTKIDKLANSGCDVISLDASCSLGAWRNQLNNKIALQGNLEPDILLQSPATIRHEVEKVLLDYGHGSGHIFNLGHGIKPNIPVDNVAVMIDAVHEFSPQFHMD